jgi:hypothetical protein
VWSADRGRAVEQGVDQREPDGVRLGASGGGAEQSGLGSRKTFVDVAVPLARFGVEGQLAAVAGVRERGRERRFESGQGRHPAQ